MDFFTQAISLAETPAEQAIGRFRKALALFQLGRKREAKQFFHESIELGLQTYYLELFTAKGHKAFEIQKASHVLSLLQELDDANSQDVRVLILRGIVLLRTGKIGEAMTVLQQVTDLGYDRKVIDDLKTTAAMESGKYAVQRMADAYSLQSTDTSQAISIYEKILNSVAAKTSVVIFKTCAAQLAKCYLKIHQYPKAAQFAQLAIEAGDQESWLIKADALFYQGKFEESLKTYDIASKAASPYMVINKKTDPEREQQQRAELQSKSPTYQPLFSYADMEMDRQKRDNQMLSIINPDFLNSMLNKATAHFALSQFSHTLEVCQLLEDTLQPIAVEHEKVLSSSIMINQLTDMIKTEKEESKMKKTVELMKNLAAPDPEVEQSATILEGVRSFLVRISRLQAVVMLSLGKKDFAQNLYDKCIEIHPSLDNYQQKIRFFMEEQNYQGVIETCDQALQHGELSQEDSREVLEIKARTLMLMHKYVEAIETFKNLHKISKTKWKVVFNIGKHCEWVLLTCKAVLYRKMGKLQMALKSLNEVLSYKTSSKIPPQYLRGIALEKAKCFMSLENFELAVKNLEEFVAISRQESLPLKHGFTLRWNLAYCYYQLNNFQRMQMVANSLVHKYPTNPISHFVMGLALQGAEKYSEALQCFERSLEIDPNQPDVQNTKSRLIQKLSGIPTSTEAYRMATPPQMSLDQAT